MKAVARHIEIWLKRQLRVSPQSGFVLGVSGGVDSALVSTLCARTGAPTLLLTLPIHQADDQVTRGGNHIKWLMENHTNVTTAKVDLTGVFETTRTALGSEVAEDLLAMANLRARLRMSTLYAYAGHYGFLVAGTGNLIEDFGIGFFTKWGDGAVDLSPIGNLSKSQVWELAKYLGVSDDIIKAKPTDGLWADNRGDEDAIGATYQELEWAMAEWQSGRASRAYEITNEYTERECMVLNIYDNRHQANQHKFNPIPVCQIPAVLL